MRDLERLHDVVEYKVSPGQLRLAFLGVLAIACAIFAVGVSVGKRIEPSQAAMSLDPLAQLDRAQQQTGASDEENEPEAPQLTYHNELTSRSESVRRPPAATKSDDNNERETHSQARGGPTSPAKRVSAVTQRSASEHVQEEPARPEQPQPGESSIFTLQVASFETREEARSFAADLRTRGHTVFLVRTSTPERGTWYRVRIGPFHSRREATRYQVRFERLERLPTFLVQRRS